jgi:hypothetical protein
MMLEKADARLPSDDEMIPKPKPHECVVFRDQFAAGLRMPCQDFIEEIMKAYNIKMHHLTPNGIAKIALFIWVVKSQRGNLDIGAFCSLHEMHTQFKNKNVDGISIMKHFGCCSFKPARGAKHISPASKNKWAENWYHYWFYHSVPLVEERDDSRRIVKRYLLAAKMSKNVFVCKPEFLSSKSSELVRKFTKLLLVCKVLVISAKNTSQLGFGR